MFILKKFLMFFSVAYTKKLKTYSHIHQVPGVGGTEVDLPWPWPDPGQLDHPSQSENLSSDLEDI